jgi:hypothetical protein
MLHTIETDQTITFYNKREFFDAKIYSALGVIATIVSVILGIRGVQIVFSQIIFSSSDVHNIALLFSCMSIFQVIGFAFITEQKYRITAKTIFDKKSSTISLLQKKQNLGANQIIKNPFMQVIPPLNYRQIISIYVADASLGAIEVEFEKFYNCYFNISSKSLKLYNKTLEYLHTKSGQKPFN